MAAVVDLTVPQNEFCLDGIPTEVTIARFDGTHAPVEGSPTLDRIVFTDPATQSESTEESALIGTFAFNGTALLTPSAVNEQYRTSLGVRQVTNEQREGKLLVLDLASGTRYSREGITGLLQCAGILDCHCQKTAAQRYILLFRTGLMGKILETVDEKGVPDGEQFGMVQRDRPGITADGARFLAGLDIAKAYMIDNTSFELPGTKGYLATQILMNPEPAKNAFVPLVYHVTNTTSQEFDDVIKTGKARARIEVGNVPSVPLPGYPVAVKAYAK
ncbi:TPA: hypothetical protein HA281_00970 [Candidatus Woesearchaeota archaeon]|nr:hypothetical protein [Candidatus Woesearchaeota archaeon]HIH91350.1 hypothetical protein [Candidatus Woesearchaeota archaeon]HII64335.1 hypothetical protein [Candidatus Woesearchaeota archaeon]HIJ19118.1 hypothetical protein [Candidatus Woesearchaeota archaeon]